MGTEYLIYVLASVVAGFYVAAGTDRKLLGFILALWIMAQPVLNAKFIIAIPGLPFELQPNRILFLFLVMYLIWGKLSGRSNAQQNADDIRRPPFEKYIYIYLFAVLVSLAVNYSSIQPKNIIVAPLEILTFLAVYTACKNYMTKSLFEAIIKAVVIFAVVSACIAIVQILFLQEFMRTVEPTIAFGKVYRAYATFQEDGALGFFTILSLIIVLVRYQNQSRLYAILPLIIVSVLFTFHRLGILIFFICLTMYMAYYSKKKYGMPVLLLMLTIPVMLVLSLYLYQQMGGHSAVVEERLKQDTVTGRFMQYQVAFESTLGHPLGMGGYENPEYNQLMAKYNMMKWVPDKFGAHPEPLAVHNGYLEVGIKHGVLAMLIFIALLVSMLRYFRRMASGHHGYNIVPFFAVLIWVLSNTTQSTSAFRAYYVILLAILCGSLTALQRQDAEKQKQSPSGPPGLPEVKLKASGRQKRE